MYLSNSCTILFTLLLLFSQYKLGYRLFSMFINRDLRDVEMPFWHFKLFHFQSLKQILVEIVNPGFIHILCRLHSTHEEARCLLKFGESSIVVHLVLIVYDEWHDAVAKAFAEEDETTNTPIAVLKWMNALEPPMVLCEWRVRGQTSPWLLRV